MKATPPDWPRVSPAIFYDDALGAIDWLCRAFDFEVRIKVLGKDGRLAHSELSYGDGVIMVAQGATSGGASRRVTRSPQSLDGANTQSLMLYVDDVDAHCARARSAGAVIDAEPSLHDYGEEYWADRSYGCRDLEQHHWWFSQRVRTATKK
ncbi:MAG TPA: VOC family protein [Steroidobacteraceae bacterium]|jgi:uncharacterized glyoxalase superfamily protein PhnB